MFTNSLPFRAVYRPRHIDWLVRRIISDRKALGIAEGSATTVSSAGSQDITSCDIDRNITSAVR